MTREEIRQICAAEEAAVFRGWDFSRLDGRAIVAEPLPWAYRSFVLEGLTPDMRILDMETGGGEFVRSLGHPLDKIAVTEAYPPNVEICERELVPFGTELAAIDPGEDALPFADGSFDRVVNRHGAYIPAEIYRVLKPGGLFVTQQVGDENNRSLSAKLIPDFERNYPFSEKPPHNAGSEREAFARAGFLIERLEEAKYESRYLDIGAIAYYAKIIEWEFPRFSTESCLDGLCALEREIEQKGYASGNEHRFLLVARK